MVRIFRNYRGHRPCHRRLADPALHLALGLLPESSAGLGGHPALHMVPESRNEKASHHVDWLGTLLVTLGLGWRHLRAD